MIFRFLTLPTKFFAAFRLALIFIILLPNALYASQGGEEELKGPETAELINVGDWQIGLAFGIGKRTSVVYQQDDIPLYLVPSIKYYDEHVFFDNGTLGYTWHENHKFAFSVITELNPLAAQFYDYHPENVLFDNALSGEAAAPVTDAEDFNGDASDEITGEPTQGQDGQDSEGPKQQPVEKSIKDIKLKQPRWSLDAGLQLNWFINQNQSLVAQVFTDVANLHNGQRFELLWSYGLRFDQFEKVKDSELGHWRAQVQLGLSYLNKTTSQYYYGIDQRHLASGEITYNAKAALNPSFSITATRPLSRHLKLLLFYKQQSLDSTISQSPKITDDKLNTYFAGVVYEF